MTLNLSELSLRHPHSYLCTVTHKSDLYTKQKSHVVVESLSCSCMLMFCIDLSVYKSQNFDNFSCHESILLIVTRK